MEGYFLIYTNARKNFYKRVGRHFIFIPAIREILIFLLNTALKAVSKNISPHSKL
jgi:hypothetical protein